MYKQLNKNVQALFTEKIYMKEDLDDNGQPEKGASKIEDSDDHIGSKPTGPVYARDFKLPAADILQALDPNWKEGMEAFKGSSYGVKVADPTEMKFLPKQMDLLMKIQWPENRDKTKWDAISVEINKQYEVEKVALLCDIQFSNDSSPTEQVKLEGERETIVNEAIQRNKGVSQDDKLTMFDSVKDATLAVIALRRGLAQWNASQTEEKFMMECNGYGIHKSKCLVIPTTDVHWGYAVNAASKIGEDCGKDGEILLMDECYQIIKDMPEFKDVFWINKQLEASGNDFNAWQLNERDGPYANTEPKNTEPENGEVAPDTEPTPCKL